MFIDHDKSAYLTDLQAIVGRGWLRPGSIVVADNVGAWRPEVPRLHARRAGQGLEHHRDETHAEYQTLIADLVLESEFLG